MRSAQRTSPEGPTDPIGYYERTALLTDRQCAALRHVAWLRGMGKSGLPALQEYNWLMTRMGQEDQMAVHRVAGGEFPTDAGRLDRLRRGATILADRMRLPR